MKLFTQLALVAAIASSGSAFALQSMDDSALGETTGQDGLTITITPPAAGLVIDQVILHDKDGLKSAPGYAASTAGGAIVLGAAGAATNKFSIVQGAGQNIQVIVDASGDAATAGPSTSGSTPVLNIQVKLPASLTINTGDISVAGSARGLIAVGSSASATTGGLTGTPVKVLDTMAISLGGATMNIQLGNTPQGSMIKLTGSVASGLTISNIVLTDKTTGYLGTIGVGAMTIYDTGSTAALTLAANIGVKPTGLSIDLGATAKYDIMMQNVTLGAVAAANSIGDVQLVGVQLTGTTIGIAGH